MTYRGRTVGCGQDCTVERTSDTTAHVTLTRIAERETYEWDDEVKPDTDLQALAIQYAGDPTAWRNAID